MGVDIHMNIVDAGGNTTEAEIFEGRNSSWFDNLTGRGWNDSYDNFEPEYGIPDVITSGKIKDNYDNANEYGYYNFYYITVYDFMKWFEKYRPDIKAGWASTYEKWRIEKKGWVPDEDHELPHYLESDMNIADHYFIEYVDSYECSRWLYNYIKNNQILTDSYIVYYFDC